MSAKSTVVRESRHHEFLQSRRRDPVTHKLFIAGDRVTRCATCLLPFLEQSWQAISRTHCGQFVAIALDDTEPLPVESGSTEQSDPKETAPPSPPENAQPKSTRLELAPIPKPLREVSINLK
jgi:hypothetical protein